MGNQISSIHRFRSRLLIQTYLKGDATYCDVNDIFDCRSRDHRDHKHLSMEDLVAVVGLDAKPTIEDIFKTHSFENDLIPISLVVEFLNSGRIPLLAEGKELEIMPRGKGARRYYLKEKESKHNESQKALKPIVIYGYQDESANRDHLNPARVKLKDNIWKKHETIIQERIVRHVTVENGVTRELVETDKSQNEVIHIECKDSGEFAHREFSQQEQTEELDKEMVTFIRASQEYVNLKSHSDEYEYTHSEIPNTTTAAEDDTSSEGYSSVDGSRHNDN